MSERLAQVRRPELEQQARSLYSADLPYHNFDHIQDTLRAAAVIVERCHDENIRIDVPVVYYGLLFHDAGYQHDHAALGHETKEAYSTVLAEPILQEFGVGAGTIKKVVNAILATEKHGSFVTAEQKAVRAADLSGMAAAYPEFLRSSIRLKREFELLHGSAMTWESWQENSREVLEFYLTQEIRLTSYFHDATGQSAFHRAVRDNLTRLLSEPAPD